MTTPKNISSKEWRHLMRVPLVAETWDIPTNETPKSFSSRVYGVKFVYPKIKGQQPACFYVLCGGFPYDKKAIVHRSGIDFLTA